MNESELFRRGTYTTSFEVDPCLVSYRDGRRALELHLKRRVVTPQQKSRRETKFLSAKFHTRKAIY
jgi:hypothetical protein